MSSTSFQILFLKMAAKRGHEEDKDWAISSGAKPKKVAKKAKNDNGEAKTKGAKKKMPTRAKKGKPTKNSRIMPEKFQDEFQEDFQDDEFKEEFGYYTMGKSRTSEEMDGTLP